MYSGYINDPDQRAFLKKNLTGDNVLLGAAGTGKTNIAIARVIALSRMENPGNILFISYTNALVNICRDDIKGLFSAFFDRPQIVVSTFHKFISDVHEKIFGRRIRFFNAPSNYIRKALMNCIDRYPEGQQEYAKELNVFIDEIVFLQNFDIRTLEEYENATRSNQKVKYIRKTVRKYYWYVYQEYLHLLRKNHYDCDFDGAAQYFIDSTNGISFTKYKNVFIDEGQDFSPAALKAITKFLDEDGKLLYLGDATQEIYGSKRSWKSVGLSINNKIVRLSKNFRNTIEIGYFAADILDNNKWEDEAGEILYPKDMVEHGKKPAIIKSLLPASTDMAILSYIQLHPDESICIVCYSKDEVRRLYGLLRSLGIVTQRFDNNRDNFFTENKLTITTYYSVKGLEFETVILNNFNSSFFDNIQFFAKDDKEELMSLATKLFYVAVTRAKSNLLIFYDDDLPEIFPRSSSNYEELNIGGINSYFKDKAEQDITEVEIIKEMVKHTFLSKEDLIYKFQTAIIKSTKEIDIQSPWMTNRVVDDLFIDKLERLLVKGVRVKITYGIEDDRNTRNKNLVTDSIVKLLSDRFKKYNNFKLQKGNSHSKILLCDDEFGIITSFNWLSYDGKSSREESGTLTIDAKEINGIRSKIFDF